MNLHHLKESVENIEMSEEMKARLIRHCKAANHTDTNPVPHRFAPKRVWGMACACCLCCLVAVLSIGVWHSGILTMSPIVSDDGSTISADHGADEHKTPGNQGGEQSNPPANSQGGNPSDPAITDPPITSQTTSDPENESDKPNRIWRLNVNRITSTISGAKKYYDPDLYYHETWNMERMTAYLGVDLSAVSGLSYTGGGEFTVTIAHDGTIAYDTAAYRYGPDILILASKIGAPFDCVYTLERNDKTVFKPDNGSVIQVSTTIGARSDGLLFADYEYNGIYYRVTATHSSEKEFEGIVRAVIAQSAK